MSLGVRRIRRGPIQDRPLERRIAGRKPIRAAAERPLPHMIQNGTSSAFSSSLDFSARSSLRIDSARMNQDRTFLVSGFFLELPFSSKVCARLYEACLLL